MNNHDIHSSMTQATASMTTFQTMREDIDEWETQEETQSLKSEPTGKHKKQGPPQTIKCSVDVDVAKQGETGKAGSIRTIGTEFEDESSYVEPKLPYNNVRRGWVVKPGEWRESHSGKEDYIMVGSEGQTSTSQCRKVMIILTFTCILFTAAFVPVCIIILRGPRRSTDPGSEETDTKEPEPDLSDPHVISQSYVHIYNGTSIENMDVVQMQEFETLLEGYTKYYVRAGGSGNPGWVTTTCKIKEQTLFNKKKRKSDERPPKRDDDDDDNGLSRNLFQEVRRDRFDEKYLEVGFTMIYASSVTNVLEEDYPTNFYKFMNSGTGKATLLENMKNIGIRVEAIDDLRLRDVPSGKITDPPTSFPTIPIPSYTPSNSPTVNPTTTHPTPSPTRRPTSRPTRRPTFHPTSSPTKEDKRWCWNGLIFTWCIHH